MTKKFASGIHGFTLVELLMALGIAGIIAAFAISISSSISGLSKQAMTKARMEKIATKARQYYRSHKVQVAAVGTPANFVPVTAAALNLEQKYRLDGWGKFLYYRVSTSISGFKVNGSSARVGAIIISSGPNQGFDIVGYNDTARNDFIIKGDDIIVGINFNQEATEITLDELQVLQGKVEAFDAQFEGINNDSGGDSDVDEDACFPFSGVIDCYDGLSVTGAVADPNCGRATLDEIEKKTFLCDCNDDGAVDSDEYMNVCCFLTKMYALSNLYLTDPWDNSYQWSSDVVDVADSQELQNYKNLRHHKFWSLGPDETSNSPDNDDTYKDDIVF
ncbi:MAG: prepilin-type N-terminal cleavage/methylation domain-containing protein [Pseudomonadota bacterium]|nr:prepilin-type N-terminal cleavage/methylation domain-containing protein [Pseudomonadota bacterium]